jgi:hypothetical protein
VSERNEIERLTTHTSEYFEWAKVCFRKEIVRGDNRFNLSVYQTDLLVEAELNARFKLGDRVKEIADQVLNKNNER